jgi:zinc transporter ZupT
VPVTVALFYALLAAGANLIGGLVITTASPRGRATQRFLIAFGAGFMLAVALLSMIPHALEAGAGAAVAVLAGYLLVHVGHHILPPHFHFGEETHTHAMVGRWVGVAALLGLMLHSFFDGVAIASGFAVGGGLGTMVFVAVILHKVPEGVTVASILLASGNGRARALGGAALLGAATVAGVLMTGWLAGLRYYGLALSAGVTLYVAASNLVPELQKQRDWQGGLGFFAGVLLYYLARMLIGSGHG